MAMISTADEARAARETINKLGTDMQALLAKAREEKREPTDDEKSSFDKMGDQREELLTSEKRYLRMAELEGSIGRKTDHRPPRQGDPDIPPRDRRSYEVTDGIRAWLLTAKGKAISPEQRDTAAKLGVVLGSREMTFKLPRFHLDTLDRAGIRDWEARALSASSASSPVDGAYVVQNELMRPLEEALLAFGGARARATVVRTDTGADLPIPTDNDTTNKGEIIDENMQIHEQDVAFGQVTLEAYKYSSKKVRVSVELLQDASFPIGPYLGRKLGTRIGRIVNDHLTTGTGVSQPRGMVTASTASGVQLAAQTPTYVEMVDIQHSVDPAYRANGAAWMFHDTMLAQIKKIIDASTGRPIWLPNMVAGAPDTILGDPYVINQSMPVAAASGAGKSILYGDLSKYFVREVRDVTLVVADQLHADYHQVAFFAFARFDGDLIDAGTHPVKHALNKA